MTCPSSVCLREESCGETIPLFYMKLRYSLSRLLYTTLWPRALDLTRRSIMVHFHTSNIGMCFQAEDQLRIHFCVLNEHLPEFVAQLFSLPVSGGHSPA